MAIAGLGNGGVPTTNIKALAGELRFLKCGLADMQGRLDALLSEIGAELQGVQGESEPAAEVLADLFATNQVITVAEIASEPVMAEVPAAPETEVAVEAVEIETRAVADAILETVEATQPEMIAPVEIADAATAVEPTAVETAVVEIAEVAVPAETIADAPTLVDAIPTVDSTEPVASVEVWSEPVVPVAEQVDTPAAELPGQNVEVLAEHRAQVGKRRGVIARTARWAAAIALIATVAAVAAAGTGFAGNGELLIKSVCAIAGEGCSITLGMP